MAITAIEGIVENGKIRLREDVSLPEHTKVYVLVGDLSANPAARIQSPRLAHPDQAGELRKQVLEIPADA